MSEKWFYLAPDGQKGPVDLAALTTLVQSRVVRKGMLVWCAGMTEWRLVDEVHPDLFAAAQWFYRDADGSRGPVDTAALMALIRSGAIGADTLVSRPGRLDWTPAGQVLRSVFRPPPAPAVSVGSSIARAREVMGNLGATISDAADLPTIDDVPVRDVLVGGIAKAASSREIDIEDELAVGTRQTTPALADVADGWPRLKLFWRMLAGSLATYALLWYGLEHFNNLYFLPGLIVVGSFVVPFSIVVAFFELNVPRNVSVYEVGKMLVLGGSLSLVVTSFAMSLFLPGAGVGGIVPALLTALGEETSKALILLIVLQSPRYPYQLNGLLFGAAIGAGFAGFESAGYSFAFGVRGAFEVALRTLQQGGEMTPESLDRALIAFVDHASIVIWLRGILAPFGHVIWTAIVGSALWRAKGRGPFSVELLGNGVVLRRWLIVIALHGLWDAQVPGLHGLIKIPMISAIGWYLVVAALKQALGEVQEAKRALSRGGTNTGLDYVPSGARQAKSQT